MSDTMPPTMPHHRAVILGLVGFGLLSWGAVAAKTQFNISTSSSVAFANTEEARQALERAQETADLAEARAEKFSADANEATAEVDRLTQESAALAARIQQTEAEILAANAQLAIVSEQRRAFDARLAEQQQPLVRLTGALQNMARRPVVLSAIQPGSLKDTVYVRAVLETALPSIREQTSDLRSDVAQSRALESEVTATLATLETSERELQQRRGELARLTVRQQQASRTNRALAQREAQRVLALAEQTRDLDDLVTELDRASGLRQQLARLQGPIVRPPRPDQSRVMPTYSAAEREVDIGQQQAFQLPVQGRTVMGFGAESASGQRSTGLTVAPAAGALIVAPAAGKVSFAGPYQGFGRIVIIEHENGWTSLITGLEESSTRTGEQVIGGSPIGTAPLSAPQITFELREDGRPVNPLIKL